MVGWSWLVMVVPLASGEPAWVAPADLAAELAAGADVRVVDLRDDATHAAGHVRESVRLGPRELRASAALARHPVVLVAPAVNPCAATALLGGLADAGFTRVRVLRGGLEAWILEGFPVERATGPVPSEPFVLRPRDLVEALRCPAVSVVLVDADGAVTSMLRGDVRHPRLRTVPHKTAPPALRAQEILVVAGQDAARARALAARWRAEQRGAVFALGAPAAEWVHLLRAETPGPPARCETCGSDDGGPPPAAR